MAKWIVTYSNRASGAGSVLPVETDVFAAYYAPNGRLVEFKDTNHQVMFALNADTVLTIRWAGAADLEAASA